MQCGNRLWKVSGANTQGAPLSRLHASAPIEFGRQPMAPAEIHML
jgi:hypothetical protein